MSRNFLSGLLFALTISSFGICVSANSRIIRDSEFSDSLPSRQSYSIYVDEEGVMRRSDSGEEVSYFGTNYTLPFAHAFRAAEQLGVDRKQAVSNDVAHMARLGLNGFRLHLWDVELSDSEGNLLQNDHLDLLDYMIAELEKRGIDIILTAQTNFGNGYPERDIFTGAYSYLYDKCDIHENLKAQEAQENYLRQLASHINPYTGISYSEDRAIIGMEINNEPCHSGTGKEVTAYINRMATALRESGFDKPIFYNVSHNGPIVASYYDADIEGTTYQWYPDGLVAGHTRRGNFLPAVERYTIPWKDTVPGFKNKAKIVYEFDPGDQLSAYLYPAIVRTFRENGFQWMTQFAYDPSFLAPYNTEYQTHFLNLLYTPSKALSMMVAAEAAGNLKRGENYGAYPADTIFGAGRVSYREDLSEWNDGRLFYHSNSTKSVPRNLKTIKRIAGVGTSPIIKYKGNGAYFLDKIKGGVWRLELLPDAGYSRDPFEKPSLRDPAAHLAARQRSMTIKLPDLGDQFRVSPIESQDSFITASDGSFKISPGVYLLTKKGINSEPSLLSSTDIPGYESDRYAASGVRQTPSRPFLIHKPQPMASPGSKIRLTAEWFGSERPDSVLIYPAEVSFWAKVNPSWKMAPDEDGYEFSAELPMKEDGRDFSYNIISFKDGEAVTWPQGIAGTPLDWDFSDYRYFTIKSQEEEAPLTLLSAARDSDIEVSRIPEAWDYDFLKMDNDPRTFASFRLRPHGNGQLEGETVLRRFVGDETHSAPGISYKTSMIVKAKDAKAVEVVDRNGYTFRSELSPTEDEQRLLLNDFRPSQTRIIPAPYPTFLERSIELTPHDVRINPADIEFVQIVFDGPGEVFYVILDSGK